MGQFGSGLHDELARAHLRGYEERASKRSLASKARRAGRKADAGAERRSMGVKLASALRATAGRSDRRAAQCR